MSKDITNPAQPVFDELLEHIQQARAKAFRQANTTLIDLYGEDEKLATLLRELPWSHNLAIFARCKSAEERAFYLELCIRERKVVEYALSRNLSPALIAQYQLQLPDKKLIQAKLHEWMQTLPDFTPEP